MAKLGFGHDLKTQAAERMPEDQITSAARETHGIRSISCGRFFLVSDHLVSLTVSCVLYEFVNAATDLCCVGRGSIHLFLSGGQ